MCDFPVKGSCDIPLIGQLYDDPVDFFYLSRSAFSEILDHRAEIISGGFCYGLHMLPDLFSVVGTAGGFKYGNGLIDELKMCIRDRFSTDIYFGN